MAGALGGVFTEDQIVKMTCPQSIKFLKLKRRLKLPHWQVVGLLESLWLFTQMNAPRGDIGRLSNEDLAATIEWDGEPDELVKILVECGFLDECDVNRLVVHDWEDHVPKYLKGALSKNKIEFAKHVAKQPAKQPANDSAKHVAKQDETEVEQPAPRLTLPSVVNSGLGNSCVDTPKAPKGATVDQREFDQWWTTYPKRKGRGAAEKAYAKARQDASAETLLAGAGQYATECKGKEARFVAHPSTWLNQKRWLDEAGRPESEPEIIDYRKLGWPKHLMTGDVLTLVEEYLIDEARAGRPVSPVKLQGHLDYWANYQADDVIDALTEAAARRSPKVDPGWVGGTKRHHHDMRDVTWLTVSEDGDVVPYHKEELEHDIAF